MTCRVLKQSHEHVRSVYCIYNGLMFRVFQQLLGQPKRPHRVRLLRGLWGHLFQPVEASRTGGRRVDGLEHGAFRLDRSANRLPGGLAEVGCVFHLVSAKRADVPVDRNSSTRGQGNSLRLHPELQCTDIWSATEEIIVDTR